MFNIVSPCSMSLKPKGSFKNRIRKLKTEDRNRNCLKSEYECEYESYFVSISRSLLPLKKLMLTMKYKLLSQVSFTVRKKLKK